MKKYLWGKVINGEQITAMYAGDTVVLETTSNASHYYVYKRLGYGHTGCFQACRFEVIGALTDEEVLIHTDRKSAEHKKFLNSLRNGGVFEHDTEKPDTGGTGGHIQTSATEKPAPKSTNESKTGNKKVQKKLF